MLTRKGGTWGGGNVLTVPAFKLFPHIAENIFLHSEQGGIAFVAM